MAKAAAWSLLLAAGLVEIGMAYAIKWSDGWSRPFPSMLALLAALASIGLLALALRGLPLGIAYAIWTGIGAVGVSLVGMLFFAEPFSLARPSCIVLIVAGSAGLKALAS
ncbi:QacE family quaternary ammonium compound efflux SMR transporter [Massilia sp. KIM]|uniref:DMT family transporter n=1 Tax=Massilia sp. KIM TaxID=1955422 RepID=UPI00098E9F51|nr:SMR family transporter [Massilia sp. KIM]OON59855.1 QacE family quaternary ammonium compound efflux SMR transporter [Massilia sp. KIM]